MTLAHAVTHAGAFTLGGAATFAYYFVWSWAPAFDLWLPFERLFECWSR